MKRTVAFVALLFTLSLMALAHGDQKHVMGTVSISDDSMTVETTSKKTVTVSLSPSTKFPKEWLTGNPEGSESR